MEFPSSASSVDEWLEAINMGKYSGAFAQAGITLHHLCRLQDDQLKQIGVAMVGQRKRLIQAGMALNVEPSAPSASAATVTGVPAQAAEDVDMADATLEPELALPPNKDPEQRRPNSTSSYYINSTITRPDTDEIVFCVAVVLHDRILQDEQAGTDERTAFPYFCEENSPLYAEPSLHSDKRKKREVPSEDTIFHSIRSIYECARFPQECLIISMVYIERLVAMSKAAILVTSWRPILLAALVLAQKVPLSHFYRVAYFTYSPLPQPEGVGRPLAAQHRFLRLLPDVHPQGDQPPGEEVPRAHRLRRQRQHERLRLVLLPAANSLPAQRPGLLRVRPQADGRGNRSKSGGARPLDHERAQEGGQGQDVAFCGRRRSQAGKHAQQMTSGSGGPRHPMAGAQWTNGGVFCGSVRTSDTSAGTPVQPSTSEQTS